MKLVKAAPALGRVKEDIDRVFDRFFSGPFFTEPSFSPFEPPMPATDWVPSFDLSETEKEYVVRLEAPGIHKENLDLNYSGDLLTITGKREMTKEKEGERYLWRERELGRFLRTVRLPMPVAAARIEASYQDGILTVRLPKETPEPSSKILIK